MGHAGFGSRRRKRGGDFFFKYIYIVVGWSLIETNRDGGRLYRQARMGIYCRIARSRSLFACVIVDNSSPIIYRAYF